jgi:hypothetical protein
MKGINKKDKTAGKTEWLFGARHPKVLPVKTIIYLYLLKLIKKRKITRFEAYRPIYHAGAILYFFNFT